MTSYAALDVSQETTAICVVDENGRIVAEKWTCSVNVERHCLSVRRVFRTVPD
jgi:hypothetical protein